MDLWTTQGRCPQLHRPIKNKQGGHFIYLIRRTSSRARDTREQTRMSLDLCILASGSSGNCTIVRTRAGVMLIEYRDGFRAAVAMLQGWAYDGAFTFAALPRGQDQPVATRFESQEYRA